ncbi:MAG: V-type ATPase subunit [Thermoprotei archaeon]
MPVHAYVTAVARIIKSGTLSKETVEEVLASKDFKELAAVLWEKKIVTREGLNTPEAILTNLKERGVTILKSLSGLSKNSKIVNDLVDAYVGLMAVDELESLISYAISLERGMVSRRFSAESNLTLLRAGLESVSTLQSLVPVASNASRTLGDALVYAITKAPKESSAPSTISNLVEAYIMRKVYNIAKSSRGDWQAPMKKILCGYADYFALSTAFALRSVEMEGCTVKDQVKDAASGNPALLYEAVKKTELGKMIKSEKPLDALSELKVLAKRSARKGAYLAFQGTPFSPAAALAAAELIRLDYQDMAAIVTGVHAKLPRGEIAKLLSFEIL